MRMDGPASGAALSVLTLSLQGEIFAIASACVQEILDMVPVTDVPGADAFVGGLINVRGRVVPLADPRLKLGLHRSPATIDTRIVVVEVEMDGQPTICALRADSVHEVAELPEASLEPVPRIGLSCPANFVSAVSKRNGAVIMVLDLAALFASDSGHRH